MHSNDFFNWSFDDLHSVKILLGTFIFSYQLYFLGFRFLFSRPKKY
jgi:hypothetical protein